MKIFHPIVAFLNAKARNAWMDEGANLITEKQARIIAAAVHEIRPQWSIDGTMKVLDRNHDHPAPFGEVLSAAVTAALDPETQTPGRIYQISTFWPVTARARLPKPEPCQEHVGQEGPTCRSCWGDVKAGLRPQTHIGKHWAPADAGAFDMEGEG